MMTIWKYALNGPDLNTFWMPKGAQILCVQIQRGTPTMWALVDSNAVEETRRVFIIGTGHEMPRGVSVTYVGTFQAMEGRLVLHVFQEAM